MVGLQLLWILYFISCLFQMISGRRQNEEFKIFFPNKDKFLDRLEMENFGVEEKKFDFKQMNISMLRKLNSVKNREEFANFFGVITPHLATRSGHFAAEEIADALTEETVSEAKNVGCAPVPTIVRLTPKSDLSVVYYPTCVLIEKCGGCCYGTLLSCQPESVEEVKLNVMKIEQGTKISERVGERPRPDFKQEFETIIEERHKTCACKCVLQAKDCNKNLQVYDSNECACKCKDKSAPSNCEKQDKDHYWDANKCFCFCRKTLDCSTGENFDQKTCRCQSANRNIGFNVGNG